jgi:glycosyltransferase involved in cell wall biosynthesis
MSGPLVSVILPAYNAEAFVARAIRSVLAQTYRPLELIVIDDGSTDGTRRVIDGFAPEVTVLTQANAGPYAARNLGIAHARGPLIAFADADDAWLPDKLARQVPLFQQPEVGLVFGDAIHVTAPRDGAPRSALSCFLVSTPRRGAVADHFVWSNFVPTCTAVVRRECLEEVGRFPSTSRLSADYLTWFRIAARHAVDYVEEPVAEYTVHSAGISSDLGRAIEARISLFAEEFEQWRDPRVRHLLFNLALSLGLAAARGRARSVVHPWRLAWRTVVTSGVIRIAPWTLAFALNQVRVRTHRLFS